MCKSCSCVHRRYGDRFSISWIDTNSLGDSCTRSCAHSDPGSGCMENHANHPRGQRNSKTDLC